MVRHREMRGRACKSHRIDCEVAAVKFRMSQIIRLDRELDDDCSFDRLSGYVRLECGRIVLNVDLSCSTRNTDREQYRDYCPKIQ